MQDDWDVTDKLQLNLGLRWDYETNMFNNNYATPAGRRAALRALPTTYYFDPEDYITDGNDREPFKGMFQPRIGFCYDINGDQQHGDLRRLRPLLRSQRVQQHAR